LPLKLAFELILKSIEISARFIRFKMGLLDRIRQRKADAERHRIKRAMRWGDKADVSMVSVYGLEFFSDESSFG